MELQQIIKILLLSLKSSTDTHFHLDLVNSRHSGISSLDDCYSFDEGCQPAMIGSKMGLSLSFYGQVIFKFSGAISNFIREAFAKNL